MLAYVLDAAREATAKAAGRRTRPRRRRSARPSPTRPTSRSRTSRAAPAMPSAPRSRSAGGREHRRALRRLPAPRARTRARRPRSAARRRDGPGRSCVVADPSGLGRVVVDAGRVGGSSRRATPPMTARGRPEINTGLYAFDVPGSAAHRRRRAVTADRRALPDRARRARTDDRSVAAFEVDDDGTLLGINDRVELADAEVEMRIVHQRAAHPRGGDDRGSAGEIEPRRSRSPRTYIIEPDVVLGGTTGIGRRAHPDAQPDLRLAVGERCVIWASVLESRASRT